MKEKIVAAAIQYGGLTFSKPAPARHGDVIYPMRDIGLPRESVNTVNQGFLTSTGRFVERTEALKIALASGQPCAAPDNAYILFSEDVW